MIKSIKYILIIIAVLVCTAGSTYAQKIPNKYSPKEIKSVFIYSFLKYINWPPDAIIGDELVIGILGENPFSPSMERILKNRTINGKKLVIKQYSRVEEGAFYSHLLYIDPKMISNLKHILSELKDAPVITVSEAPGFCENGGIINFSKVKYKYGFEINLKAAHKVKLEISSKLTGLATKVIED